MEFPIRNLVLASILQSEGLVGEIFDFPFVKINKIFKGSVITHANTCELVS